MRKLSAELTQCALIPRQLGSVAVDRVFAEDRADAEKQAQLRQQATLAAALEQARSHGLQQAQEEIDRRAGEVERKLAGERQAEQALATRERGRLQELINGLDSALRANAAQAEEIAVEVAFACTVRLLGEKLADRSLMVELCQKIATEYAHPSATLRVSDTDLLLFEGLQLDIPVSADRRLAAGQCVIDTARGQFQSGLEERLEALKQALLAGLARHRTAE